MTPRDDDEMNDVMLPDNPIKILKKMFVDIYMGKDTDNPALTTRMDRMERQIEQMLSVLGRLAYVVIGTLAAVGGEIVLRLLHKL